MQKDFLNTKQVKIQRKSDIFEKIITLDNFKIKRKMFLA